MNEKGVRLSMDLVKLSGKFEKEILRPMWWTYDGRGLTWDGSNPFGRFAQTNTSPTSCQRHLGEGPTPSLFPPGLCSIRLVRRGQTSIRLGRVSFLYQLIGLTPLLSGSAEGQY
jgi:hypothetical protein